MTAVDEGVGVEGGQAFEAVERLARRGSGRLLIPAFAVGRTQNLLYTLARLFEQRPQGAIEVVVDSPLATAATRIVASHPEYFDKEALGVLRRWTDNRSMRLRFTETVDDSKALNTDPRPTVLVSASGMMESGRVLHHLAWNIGRDDCEILVVGYQARGTLGRRIVEGVREVNILGERYAVKARVTTLMGFSAHADREGLLAALTETLTVVSRIAPKPELIDLFRVRWDFRNLRSLIKASLLKVPAADIGLARGPGTIDVEAWKGPVGSESLGIQIGITPGTEVTFNGFAGSPNDVYWVITGDVTGESTFHLSC